MKREERLVARDQLFWSNVQKLENGCWEWVPVGYHFSHRGCTTAKQVAWLLVRGVPTTKRLWRTCENERCLNPDHMAEI